MRRQTLVAMAVMSITMFMGITLLAHAYAIVPNDTETVVSQIARATFGGRSCAVLRVQAATMAILVLAANTAYADFPRLASIVARDRFLPRQFMNQGDRLAFSNGILILSVLAAVLLGRLWRRHARADPALHDWRVRVVHACRRRAWCCTGARLADAGMADERGDQRLRRTRHRHRADDRRDDEGRRGRVDHHRDDSGAGHRSSRSPGGTTITCRRADAARLADRSRRAATSCWCRSAAFSAPSSRRCVRATLSNDVRAVYRGDRFRRNGGAAAAVGRSGGRTSSSSSSNHPTDR